MEIKEILSLYKSGELDLDSAIKKLTDFGTDEMGFATLDTVRQYRTGIPEIIFAKGKTVEQVSQIAERLYNNGIDILATKATQEMYDSIQQKIPEAKFNSLAGTVSYKHEDSALNKGYIAVVAAGTSDLPVAEEAVETARFLSNKVEKVYDVGVAGIHRLFHKLDVIKNARVIIAVAGMEGALASVVGGLVDKPVIGVPTSVGYGTGLNGLSALLTMLNSCASGISVVNIDNGFGAACQAHLINRL